MSHPPSNAAPPAPLVPLLSAVEWRGLRPMASAPGQIQPARGGMAERHVGRRIARGCDERRDCAPPTDPDPGVVTPVCERRSANRSATRGRGLVGAQALERHQIRTACSPMARRRSCLQRRSSPPEFKVAIADEGAPPKHSGSHSKPRSEGASASGRRDQTSGTRRQGHWVRGLEASSAPLDAVEG